MYLNTISFNIESMKRLLWFGLMFFQVCCVQAQDERENPKLAAQKDYQFTKEASGGLKIQTSGFSLYAEFGWIKNIYRTHLLQAEYQYNIDYREKLTKSFLQSGRSYRFGLQNRFHIIRFSYGFESAIADKAARNGVRLSWVAFGGVSLGLLKPYYLVLDYPDVPDGKAEKYSEANKDVFLNKTRIIEAAPFYKGIGEMKPIVGGHLKAGLNFDWGSRDAFVKAIEAGIQADLYYKKVPIMVDDNANQFFMFGFYLGIHLGKRW